MRQIQIDADEATWNAAVEQLNGHPLQLWAWGEVKGSHGWKVDRILVKENGLTIGGAQVLIKPLPRPFKALAYIPRGPFAVTGAADTVRSDIVRRVQDAWRPVVLTAEPDSVGEAVWPGWRKAVNRILLPRTAVLDLRRSEEEMLKEMSKKTRQYIRKSAGEGIEVVEATSLKDIDECLVIYRQTADRAGFAIHGDSYYHAIFTKFGDASPVYMARHKGKVVAFLWPVVTSDVAFELYGGMNEEGQRLRANYHLKWTVIQRIKQRGVRRYDVNGLLNDGVSAFKQGFIPSETMMSGTFDYPMSPLYQVWVRVLPGLKKAARRIRR